MYNLYQSIIKRYNISKSEEGSSYSGKNSTNHAEEISSAKSDEGEGNDFMGKLALKTDYCYFIRGLSCTERYVLDDVVHVVQFS